MRKSLLVFIAVLSLAGTNLEAATINVALGKVATANSEWSTSTAAKAVDGDLLTYWNAGDHGLPADPNWLVVDLTQVYSAKSIDVIWQRNDGMYAGYTNSYNVYSSLDGLVWSFIGSGVFVDETGVAPDYLMSASWSFPLGLPVQYVKYEVDGGSHWTALSELEVYAEAGPEPIPEPASMLLFGTGLVGLRAWRRRQR